MKTNVKCMQWRSALVMMLMLVSPFLAFAQTDDIYFVPTKSSEKQTIVVERVSDKYNIVDETKVTVRNVDEYNRRNTYTDDPEQYIEGNYGDEYVTVADDYQDYDYSTRIVRFRSPSRAISNIYWDLAYTSYVNDWYIYDNGYSIDIYPTINNPLYYLTDFAWNSLTWYNWRYWYNRYSWNYSYWDWYHPGYYCSYSPYWYHHHHNSHWYNSYWNNHIHANRWHSGRNLRNSITRGGISARKHDTRGAGYGNDRGREAGRGGKNGNGGVDLRGNKRNNDRNTGRTVAGVRNDKNGNENNGKVDLRGKDKRNGNIRDDNGRNGKGREIKIGGNTGARRQQPARTGVNGSKNNENSRKNGAVNSNTGARRQQPARTTVNGNRNNESSRKNGAVSGNTGARRQQPARSVNNGNGTTRNSAVNTSGKDVRQRGERGGASAQGQNSVNRRSSSTGNYNRQSSTNATRSRSTSTQTRSSSGSSASGSRSRGGGSSYSSSRSSSSRSSSSSYSGGSSSRSGGGGSSSGGGGSRGSGGGGSRGGGRGR